MTKKTDTQPAVDWEELRNAAQEAAENAYVPYSNFPVGAAALTDDGRIIPGCNVENASHGIGLCAECCIISTLAMSGGGKLRAITCVDKNGKVILPCGRCRQLLFEHAEPGMQIETDTGILTIEDLLPRAFGPGDLKNV